jgi:ABC-type Fe3+/spermidine/putrescine transport system ATPase subunit
MTLKIENLSQKTDEKLVFRDVSFEVKKGEIFGIFSFDQNSTTSLINVIAGVDKQVEGKIFFDGEEFSNLSTEKRGFHFPQRSENSFLGSIFKSKETSPKKVGDFDKILQTAENVLLLNNPFCCLDRFQRDDQAERLRQIAREKNLVVILTTNNYEEIFSTCDRVAILENGNIIQTGTPREVYEKPNSVAVAIVTGRNNLITARRITSTKIETPEFQTIEGEHRLFTDKVEKQELGAINQNITLAIRPEHISISFGASFPEDNLLKAEITDVKYLGASTLIKLHAKGLSLDALVLRLVGLNVGDECVVGLPPDRILVLKD